MIGIIIPTYNRTEYLKRAFNFYNSKSELLKDVNFYIYDSSNEINYVQNFNNLKKFPNLNIIHKRYSNQQNEFLRLYESSFVEDDYILQIGDDDFIIPESLKAAQIFLDNNDDYVACSGMRLSFSLVEPDDKNVKGLNINITRTVPGPYWPLNNPIERFKTYMRWGIPLQHFLIRNFAYKKMYEHLYLEYFKTSLLSQDLLPCAKLVILGNIKRLDRVLSYIRQESENSTYKSLEILFEEDDFPKTLRETKSEISKLFLEMGYKEEEITPVIETEFVIRFTQLLQWVKNTKYQDENEEKMVELQEKHKFIPSTQMYYKQIIRDIFEVCKK